MAIKLDISTVPHTIKKTRLKELLKLTVEKLSNQIEIPKNGIIELSFVNDKEIKELNKQIRFINKPTDVLSFSFMQAEGFPTDDLLGEIVISTETARKQAEKNCNSFDVEIYFLFVHGLLHVFGFNHEEREQFEQMFSIHKKIMPEANWEIVDEIYREYFS
ncbi:rRNA maturation RNase YbeY [Candidatus Peregrinibacteria bacterium]|nr:rRNA maturation RNase YbeY [Candidatus Peregrinibacteria bacterium]